MGNVGGRPVAEREDELSPLESDQIRVLVVDDHEMFAVAISRFIAGEAGMAVVGDGQSLPLSLELASAFRPSVAVVNVDMIGIPGFEAVRQLLECCPAIRVIALTDSVAEQRLVDAIVSGCSGFVTKSRAFDELPRAIRSVQSGEVFLPSGMLAALLPAFTRGQRPLGSDLSPREVEVLALTADGLSNREIADRLFLSVHTIRNHIQNVLSKLNAHSRLEAVIIATREGVLARESARR